MTNPRITRFRDLVAQQPTNELFRFSLAQALDAAGELTEAETHYRSCVGAKADWMLPRILLGKLLLKTDRASEAKPLLEDALQLALDQDHEDPAAELQEILRDLT
jgi:predicted Zn-dependent protease